MHQNPQPNNFDGIRLLLALCVLCGHQDSRMQWAGDCALAAFFSVSGLLVSRSWFADPHVWRFAQRRLLRVLPGLFLVVSVCAAGAYVFAAGPFAQLQQLAAVFYLKNLWLSVFDWSFFPWRPAGMNGSIWSLPFEVDLYGVLALIGLMGRKPFLAASAAVFLFAFSAQPPAGVQASLGTAWSLYFAGFFFAGGLLSSIPVRATAWMALLGLAGGAILLASDHVAAARLLAIPAVVAAIGERSWPVLRSLARFGDLSYGAYIWAWPIQQVTRLWLSQASPTWLQLAVVIPEVAVCALVSWHLIEKRALRLKPRARDAIPRVRSWRIEVGSLRDTWRKISALRRGDA